MIIEATRLCPRFDLGFDSFNLNPRRTKVIIEIKGRLDDHLTRLEQLDAMQCSPNTALNTPVDNANCWAGAPIKSIPDRALLCLALPSQRLDYS